MDNTGDLGAGYRTPGALPGDEVPPSGIPDPAAPPPQGARLSDAINAVYASVRQTAADFFELFTLEMHRAGVTFMWMLAWSTVGVLLMVTAWLGLMAGLALWLISLGMSPAAVVIGIAMASLLGGVLIFSSCMRASSDLLLSATRRQLRVTASEVKAKVRAL
ncbi:MAG: hypothetical protein ABI547_05735, partial [Betaproteobacteria bacterium]